MKRLIPLALAAALLPQFASASDLSYTYVEGGYVRTSIDGLSGDANGIALSGSVELGDSNAYLFGGLSKSTLSVNTFVGEVDVDVDTQNVGVGYAINASDAMDVLLEASYQRFDVEGIDGDGYRLSAGLRGEMSESVEAWVRANYDDSTDSGSEGEFSLAPGFQYKFNETWGLVGEAEFGDGGQTYFLGGRASF